MLFFRPAFSPVFNPIENIWNKMKDWLMYNYAEEKKTSYDELRKRVIAAWEAIGAEVFDELVSTMPQRCQDIIDAQGGNTEW